MTGKAVTKGADMPDAQDSAAKGSSKEAAASKAAGVSAKKPAEKKRSDGKPAEKKRATSWAKRLRPTTKRRILTYVCLTVFSVLMTIDRAREGGRWECYLSEERVDSAGERLGEAEQAQAHVVGQARFPLTGKQSPIVLHTELTGSTQDDLADLWREGSVPAGAVMVADDMTAARGRVGRPWFTRAGKSLLVSVLLEFDESIDQETPVAIKRGDSRDIDGLASRAEIAKVFGSELPEGPFDTIGGYVVNELGRMPRVGDEVRWDGRILRVRSLEGRRIAWLRAVKADDEERPAGG